MTLSVVIPAYREAENLDILLPKLQRVLKGYEYDINIIDTISPMDNTKEICYKYGVNYIPREGGNLYGDAIRTGFKKARYDHILIMDADGSHNPQDFLLMLNEAKSNDLVIGSRYIKGGKTDNPKILIFMSLIVNVCFRIAIGLNVKDISDSLRIYNSSQVKRLNLECNNFDIVEEIIIKLAVQNKGLTIKEVPITFNKRMYGESKRDLFKFALSYISTIYKLVKIKRKAQREDKKAIKMDTSLIRQLSGRYRHSIIQLMKFCFVGLSNAIVLLAVYNVLLFFGIHYIISYTIGFILSVLNAYFWNNRYIFRGSLSSIWNKLVKVYASYITTFLLSTALLYFWVQIVGMNDRVAPIVNIIITTPINFLMNKKWAFK